MMGNIRFYCRCIIFIKLLCSNRNVYYTKVVFMYLLFDKLY